MTLKENELGDVETQVKLNTKAGHKVLGTPSANVHVKHHKSDIGGEFYIYDLFDAGGKIIAQNRYVYVNSLSKPFRKLTNDEKLVLNPPIVEEVIK